MEIVVGTPAEACVEALATLYDVPGYKVSPRAMPTIEVIAFHITVEQPWMVPFDLGMRRQISPFIAALEVAQIIGQTAADARVSEKPGLSRFMDDGVMEGSYGPRVRGQLRQVVEELQRDPDSRRGVVTIYNGQSDFRETSDVPCTVGFQFLIRDDKLQMVTVMRSQDAFLGLPYDLHMFCSLQCAVAQCLGVEPGLYMHHVGSFHTYLHDAHRKDDLEIVETGSSYRHRLFESGSLETITQYCQACLCRQDGIFPVTDFEFWLRENLK